MKKILLSAIFVLTASVSYADQPVQPQSLPQNIQSFVANNFPGAGIIFAERDFDSFEVKLNNGSELDFDKSGNWKEIKSYDKFPVQVLPGAVVNSVKAAHPQATIIKAERKWGGFEIKTSNNMEIMVQENGQIMGQKFDD